MSLLFYTKTSVSKAGKRPRKGGLRRAATKSYAQLERLAKTMGSAVEADLFSGITTFKRSISKADLAKAWGDGDHGKLFAHIPWDALPDHLAPALEGIGKTVHKAAGIALEKMPPNVNANLRFDMNNPRLRSYVHTRTGALVVGIKKDVQEIIQNTIARSFNNAMTPNEIASQIKGSIGLYPAQERALANHRAGLEAAGVDPENIDTFAEAYEDRLLTYRSRMIARTESRAAITQGQLSVWGEGVAQGFIDSSTAQKEWWVDGDPCEICDPMDGKRVGLDDSFMVEFPDGTIVPVGAPPVHPHCMCGMELHFIEHGVDDESEG